MTALGRSADRYNRFIRTDRRTASRGPAFTETYTFNTLNQYTGVAVAGAGPP